VTARGFAPTQFTATIVQPSFDVISLQRTINTLDPDNAFAVRTGIVSTPTNPNFLSEIQTVRAGAVPVVASIRSNTPTVGVLKKSPTDAGSATATVQIIAGQSQSPGSLTNGGVAHRPKTAGTTSILTSIPGYLGTTSISNGDSILVTVQAPTISVG